MSNTSEIRVETPFPVIWLLFVNSALSVVTSHKRHLENHGCVVEKVALLCFVLPFDPTRSTIHCLLRSIAPILGIFNSGMLRVIQTTLRKYKCQLLFVLECVYLWICDSKANARKRMAWTSWISPLNTTG